MDIIYTYLGNRCNHERTVKFVESGFDITDYSGDDIVCSMHMSDGFKETDFCSYGAKMDEKV